MMPFPSEKTILVIVVEHDSYARRAIKNEQKTILARDPTEYIQVGIRGVS